MEKAKIGRKLCRYNVDGSKKTDPLVELHRKAGVGSPARLRGHKTVSSGFKLNRNSTDRGELNVDQINKEPPSIESNHDGASSLLPVDLRRFKNSRPSINEKSGIEEADGENDYSPKRNDLKRSATEMGCYTQRSKIYSYSSVNSKFMTRKATP